MENEPYLPINGEMGMDAGCVLIEMYTAFWAALIERYMDVKDTVYIKQCPSLS